MKCVSSLCLLLILHASAYHLEPARLDHFIKDVAPDRRVDIVFVIDQLTHADKERFYSEGRRLVEAVLMQYVAIHKNHARVAVITFAGSSRVLLDYINDDDTTITKCDFFGGESPPWKRVDYISDLESASGKALAGPLRLARYILYIGRLRRSSVKQIILLLTDGNFTDSEEAMKEAKVLRDDAVAVYTCGTGSPSWHDARVRVLASTDGFYGSYEDWQDMLTTNLTSYTSDTHPQWSRVANDDLCQPACIAQAVCQCDILRGVTQCLCEEGYHLINNNNNNRCTVCPRGTYRGWTTGDGACDQCPPGYNTIYTSSESRDDCYCQSNHTCVDECEKSDRCPDKRVCMYRKDKLECECRKGWNGTDCRTNPDNCINNDCKDGAACFDMLDDYACIELVSLMKPAETTEHDSPASDTRLGFTAGLAAGVGGTVVVTVIIVVVAVIIFRRKSLSGTQPCSIPSATSDQNNSNDQNEQNQRDSTNDDYQDVSAAIDETSAGPSGRSGSATYTSLTASTEAGDDPVYLVVQPEV